MKRSIGSRLDPSKLTGIGGIIVVAVTLCASPSTAGGRREAEPCAPAGASADARAAIAHVAGLDFAKLALYRPILNAAFAPLPRLGHSKIPLTRASLVFVVSVCLGDVEYSIACRQRSLLEAALRLEQIYLDDYTNKRVAGSLTIWFPLKIAKQDQLLFLRDVEDVAIKAVVAKLQSTANSAQLQSWRDAATREARAGSNWLHDWSARSHRYRPGQALYQLAHLSMALL